MKVLAVFLLCAFVAAVQGRSAVQATNNGRSVELGEKPWIVHLRIAIASSGYLQSAVGSLISSNRVLTAASPLLEARFIWVRYGAVNVLTPSLVTETSSVSINGPLALVNLNRFVEPTPNIAPIGIVGDISAATEVCGYGASGDTLACYEISVEDNSATSDDLATSDIGAGIQNDNLLSAVLTAVEDGALTFVEISDYEEWINSN